MGPIAKRYENFEATLVELKVLEECIKYNTDFLNSLVNLNLFRIKNMNTLLPKKDNKDTTLSKELELGSSTLMKSKKYNQNTKML